MDDEENQDQLINRNSSQGKNRRQGPFATNDDDDVEESDESGSEDEEDDLDEEDGEEEDGSDSEEDDDEDEQELPLENSERSVSAADLNDGSSSDDERENCPICLNGFRDQVVGTPENCNHYFCLDCIVEWSKNANSCPVDRINFSCIHIRTHYGGDIIKKVPIKKKAGEIIEVDDDPTNCEVCGRSDREDRLLLCDGCDAGYHMECLIPALHAIPVDEWFCPECAATNQSDEDQVSEEEVSNLLSDVVPTTTRLRTNVVRTRAIARTRQSERVRANVSRIRTTARNTRDVPRYLLSLLDETIEAVVAGLNTAVYTRNLTPRPAPTRRRRKTGKKAPSKGPKGGRGVGRRRKRRVKRRSRKQTSRKAPTSHRRIAKSLGLCCPTRGSTIPRIQRPHEHTLGSMRSDIGAARLSVFGNPYDLDPFDSNEDNASSPSSPLTAKRRVLSRSALRSHQPVARPISVGLSRGGVAPLAHGSVAVTEPVPDLLGSILSGQSMLMMKSSDITISRDGSLMAKKSNGALLQRRLSGEAVTSADVMEPSPSHSGSPTTTPFINTLKPAEQPAQPLFPLSSLYSMTPSPPSLSSRGLDRLTGPSSSMSGGPTFRLKNAFTPRAVQVQSSGNRLVSKHGESSRFNGTFHKPEPSSLCSHTQSITPELKHPTKPATQRLDISEFPRIPKIKKETDNSPNTETGRRLEPSSSNNPNANSSRPTVNKLTGRGESNQLGRFTTAEATERHSQQESQAHLRSTGGASSSYSASSDSKASPCSNTSRNIGSSDSGGGGLRITISGGSTNSCRQFSPVAKDPFRTSDGKSQQKVPPNHSATIKKEKTVKNEIYDPFEPTGSDSGSPSSSPERPATPPPPPPPPPQPPSASETSTGTPQSSGVKVGAFRSFKFTSHSSKVGASKLGPDFSGMSPTNKEPEESKSQVKVNPVLPPFLKLEKEIKKEVIEEELNEHPPFRVSCPLGLKITSDLKAGGTRGFHFDADDHHPIVKPDPDVLLDRTCLQSTSSNRLSWDAESPPEPTSLSSSRTSETPKKKTVKEELKVGSSSTSRRHSRDRESRSPSLPLEDRERDRKYKSKSHKAKRARSDRSSSGSCERKKKRQKERKKEKKRKRSESRERRRSRSSSRSSSSRRAYNSKKKKKKKRDSRSESPRRSISPDKERKRKHKTEKSYTSKEGSSRVKEKKKSKEEREKQKSKSPETVVKEYKAHKSKDKLHFRDAEITRHIVLSPNNNEKTITCTVSFKTESPTIVQETKKTMISLTKDEDDEIDPFLFSERKVSIKEESSSEFSDHGEGKEEINSPPWSPSLLDTLLPETKSEDVSEPPSPQDMSPVNYLPPGSGVESPQDSPMSTSSDPPSPEPHSPQIGSHAEVDQSATVLPVKNEADDLQWSPSHLDDLLLNDLSDDVCSLDAASPVDVDLEEALLMKRESDYKEPTVINFSKTTAIPFLQDDENSMEAEAGNHINERNSNSGEPQHKSDEPIEEEESGSILMSKSKPQIKRVTWNLHNKESEKSTPEQTLSSPFYSSQNEESWLFSLKNPDVKVSSSEPDPSSETSSPVTWTAPDTSAPAPGVLSVSQPIWNAVNRHLTPTENKPEDKAVVLTEDRLSTQAPDRPVKEASQVPWVAADKPLQVFPQTLPPLPLPPVFPPYAPMSEPSAPCTVQSNRTLHSQTPKAGTLATDNEPKIQAASAGEEKEKSKPKKEEKVKNEEYMKKLHMQERAVEEVKLAIKPFYQKREITKDEYKEILRKAVQKICHSKSGEINPVKVVNLVKGYVDKYKHIRNKNKKSGDADDHVLGQESPI